MNESAAARGRLMSVKSPWKWVGTALVAVALGTLYTVVASKPPVPVYLGKTLYEWGDQLQAVQRNYSDPNRWHEVEAARTAIRAFGTNALPFVMSDVTAHQTLKDKVIAWIAPRAPLLKLKPLNVSERWVRGITELEALGPIADPCLPQLIELAQKSSGYSEAALMGVGTDALPAFTNLLAGSKFPQTGNLIGALANAVYANRISPEEAAVALPQIVRVFNSTDNHGKWYAASALGAIRQQPDVCVPLLISGLNDPSPTVRASCVESLGRFGDAASAHADVLMKAFDSADANTRRAICGALANFHSAGASASSVLVRGLQDADQNVRIWAAISLGQLASLPEQSIPALSQALQDRDATVRLMAAQSLGQFGPQATNAIPMLERALSDTNESVRAKATAALSRIRM